MQKLPRPLQEARRQLAEARAVRRKHAPALAAQKAEVASRKAALTLAKKAALEGRCVSRAREKEHLQRIGFTKGKAKKLVLARLDCDVDEGEGSFHGDVYAAAWQLGEAVRASAHTEKDRARQAKLEASWRAADVLSKQEPALDPVVKAELDVAWAIEFRLMNKVYNLERYPRLRRGLKSRERSARALKLLHDGFEMEAYGVAVRLQVTDK